MAQRPIQHTTADQGVAEIVRILTASEWACERVQADYGEDLVCQTSYKGTIDPHRILIQVKASKNVLGKKPIRLKVKKETLLKWLSDSNIVVVCFWSITSRRALYQIPSDQFDLYSVDLSNKKHFYLDLLIKNELNSAAIYRIEWLARFQNINRQFLEVDDELTSLNEDFFDTADEYQKVKKAIEGRHFSISLKFLIYIGLLQKRIGHSIVLDTRAYLFELMNLGAFASNKNELRKLTMSLEEILLTVILMRAKRTLPGLGVPAALVGQSVKIYSEYLIEVLGNSAHGKSIRKPSRKWIRSNLESLAKRLWVYGGNFTPEMISEFIKSERPDAQLFKLARGRPLPAKKGGRK